MPSRRIHESLIFLKSFLGGRLFLYMLHYFCKPKVGIDIVEVSRFFGMSKEDSFLVKAFSEKEREYCFAYKNPVSHLAGMFAAKEAVSKALGVRTFPFITIEIFHTLDGAPYACKNNKKLPVVLSISHTKDIAVAVAIG